MTNERVRERLESIQTKVLNQHDEIVRLRGELEAAIRRCATAERRVWDLEHASPPAPSGWQPIEVYDPKKHGERILTPRGIAYQSSCGYWNCEGDAEAFTYTGPRHFMPLPSDPPKEEPR